MRNGKMEIAEYRNMPCVLVTADTMVSTDVDMDTVMQMIPDMLGELGIYVPDQMQVNDLLAAFCENFNENSWGTVIREMSALRNQYPDKAIILGLHSILAVSATGTWYVRYWIIPVNSRIWAR